MNQRGFSLIELLIVIALIGILTSISYPSYLKHIERSHCKQAKISLYQAANRLERYAMINHGYQGATRSDLAFNQLEKNIPYIFSIQSINENHFQIAASAINPTQDKACRIITINDNDI
jgi:type IV pilus assembly protein PilE